MWNKGHVADHSVAVNETQTMDELVKLIEAEETNYRMSLQHSHPLGPWQAILKVVLMHHSTWALQCHKNPFQVLDLACGPRGEPGTTIAHALPFAEVHCTDSCHIAIAAVLVGSSSDPPNKYHSSMNMNDGSVPHAHVLRDVNPPINLTKSVQDLTDLAQYESNTINVIVCCYGYSLSSDVSMALTEAHRVLVKGGILVIATWEQSALLIQGNSMLSWVQRGHGNHMVHEDEEIFFVPAQVPKLSLSGEGEMEGLLVGAGFDHPGDVVTTFGTYPFDFGRQTKHQFAMGTLLIQEELKNMRAFKDLTTSGGGGHWKNLAEEAFWINVDKHTVMVDGNMMLPGNVYKLTTSTKQ